MVHLMDLADVFVVKSERGLFKRSRRLFTRIFIIVFRLATSRSFISNWCRFVRLNAERCASFIHWVLEMLNATKRLAIFLAISESASDWSDVF